MILHTLVAAALANPFTSFSGTGRHGTGEAERPRTIACYGDSITQGAGAPIPYPAALDGLLPGGTAQGYFVSNEGISGETAHEIYKRVVSASEGIGSSSACLGTSCGFYVVQGMVNTLKGAGFNGSAASEVASVALNGSTAIASGACNTAADNDCGMLDSIDYLHAAHPRAKVFAIGVTPYAGCDNLTCPNLVEPGARAAAANAGLLSECASRPWLTCIIPYDALEDPNNPDHLRPSMDSGDGIHPNNTGAAAIARSVFDSAVW